MPQYCVEVVEQVALKIMWLVAAESEREAGEKYHEGTRVHLILENSGVIDVIEARVLKVYLKKD